MKDKIDNNDKEQKEIKNESTDAIEEGNELEADLDAGVIYNKTTSESFKTQAFPEFIQKIITSGGLVEAIKSGVIA